jgi:hypothetical protein
MYTYTHIILKSYLYCSGTTFLVLFINNFSSIFIKNNDKVDEIIKYDYTESLFSPNNSMRLKITTIGSLSKSLFASVNCFKTYYNIYKLYSRPSGSQEHYAYFNMGYVNSQYAIKLNSERQKLAIKVDNLITKKN